MILYISLSLTKTETTKDLAYAGYHVGHREQSSVSDAELLFKSK